MTPAPTLDFYTDPAEFLAAADGYLGAHPVLMSVVASVTGRAAEHGPLKTPYAWWVVARAEGEIVGVAMRTAPFEPYPLYVSPLPEAAAVELARALYERGEHPGGVNGSLPAARLVAEESARLWGGTVETAMATRLWELGDLVVPAAVPGKARLATYADVAICRAWFRDFGRAAREQSGNADSAHGEEHHDEADMRERIDEGRILLWEDAGEVVHLTAFSAPAFGVARIGPVYTPKARWGRGYASAAVAEVARRLLEAGVRVCLFTDQDNPVSNHVYAKLGFRPVVDMANHTLVR
ncbi:GNAT family N-acetyltransferase [Nocardioides sp. NPDC051685]|uniref:GNAT family N-acetyltransferase n=1 Tax=Nocardioides sp. NPDC051685 TaxID=3364334 RepID=UPI0037AE14E8